MLKHKETRLDSDKFLNSENIRINLLLASLYLAAYEILKSAIIDSVKLFFPTPEDYEKEIGIKFDEIEQYALIPSCEWLQKMGAITKSEVGEFRQIRKHRNEIAHELHILLVGEEKEVNLGLFKRIRELLRKINIFWARFDLQFDARTLEPIDMGIVRDEDILSSREIILSVIMATVTDYLERRIVAK